MPTACDETLPEGWISASLGDVAAPLRDGSHNPPAKQPFGRPMLSARNVENGKITFRDCRLVADHDFTTEYPRTNVKAGDVLLTIVGSIGRSAVVPKATEPFALQRSVAVIKPILLDPRFLMYHLQSRFSQDFLEDSAAGTAQKGVYLATLGTMPLRLAPIKEQERIVDTADDLLAHLNSARDHLFRVPAVLKRFRKAVLAAACSGRLTEDWRLRLDHPNKLEGVRCEGWSDEPLPSGWSVTTVGEIATVQGGKRLPKGTPYASYSTAHPYIRVTDFRNMSISSEDLRYIDETTHRAIKRYTISDSDLYISIAGTIGKVGLVPPHLSGANLTENAAKITDLRNVRKTYLSYSLNAPQAQDQIEEYITSSGQPKLALFRIEKLLFPLPPPEEQDEIIVRIGNLFRHAEVIEEHLNRATQVGDKLTQSILAKAFRGELVTTEAELARREDRDYEPASVLLERIKAARASLAAEKEKRPRRTTHRGGKHRAVSV